MSYFNRLFTLFILSISITCLAQEASNEGLEFISLDDAGTVSYAARHGGRNGGDGIEIEIEVIAKKITSFLHSELGQKSFPEINLPHLDGVMKASNFTTTSEVLIDKYGETRTCLNDQSTMEIICDINRWTIIKDPKVYYILVFHEILGLMNLELGYNRDVSMYPISFKLIHYIKEVENSDFAKEVLRPEYYSLNKVSYGIEVINKKTHERLRLICLERLEVHQCSKFSFVRTFKDKQAPLNNDLSFLTRHDLESIHYYLQEFKRKAYIKNKELELIDLTQNLNNYKGTISLMGQENEVSKRDFKNIESLIILSLKRIEEKKDK